MNEKIAIHWFRQDLRLSDNPALTQAVRCGPVLPIFILDDGSAGDERAGAASRWWLHHALNALAHDLGNRLSVYRGDARNIIDDLVQRFDVRAIFWNRCYEPWRRQRDKDIAARMKNKGIDVHTFNGSLLWEPWTITKDDGTPYKVFTPFFRRACAQAEAPRAPLPKPDAAVFRSDPKGHIGLEALDLLPAIRWDAGLDSHWNPGEDAAQQRLEAFVRGGLARYKGGRDLPAQPYVSRLSPHLHFGEISPNQIWYDLEALDRKAQTDPFCRQLAWREFAYTLLYFHPSIREKNLQAKFDTFPWVEQKEHLRAWQRGQTGVPIVDAGMRELRTTGYMHNRVRMIVGSFLVKNLRIDWHHGERWFWDQLVDADLANNSASWQWIAGCGADAAPYFRIFNPVAQAHKFDQEGRYIRRYLPEIARLPTPGIFCPWNVPQSVLKASGVRLGETYPYPIVDLKQSRKQALEAFRSLRDNVT